MNGWSSFFCFLKRIEWTFFNDFGNYFYFLFRALPWVIFTAAVWFCSCLLNVFIFFITAHWSFIHSRFGLLAFIGLGITSKISSIFAKIFRFERKINFFGISHVNYWTLRRWVFHVLIIWKFLQQFNLMFWFF